MNIPRFATVEEAILHFEDKNSEILAIVDKDGTEHPFDRVPLGKEKVKWTCANNKAHESITGFGGLYKREELNCRSCGISKSKTGKTYETFVVDLAKEDWKMVSDKREYTNTKSIMRIICHQEHETTISYANWAKGERSCIECKNCQTYTIDFIREEFEQKGYELLETDYINNHTKMRCICKCGRENMVTYGNFKRNISGCISCSGRASPQQIKEMVDHQNCQFICVGDASDTKKVYEDALAGSCVIIFGEPEFILNATYIVYGCSCGKEMYRSTWKAFKKGIRCNNCTKEKIRKTCMELYGVPNPFNSAEIQNKAIQTRLAKYGVEYPMQLRENVEKAKQTNIKNHGGVHNSFLPEQIKARNDAFLKKYGAKFGHVKELNEKARAVCKQKYGVDYPLQSMEIHKKLRKTNLEKYGVEHYIASIHFTETMIRLYGVSHAMQNAELFSKAMKAAFSSKPYTFPSGRMVLVQGYERFALRDLIKEGIEEDDIIIGNGLVKSVDYIFEEKNRVYYPDIYVKSLNLLIEVKSEYTFNKDITKNICKFEAACKECYFELRIYSSKGEILVRQEF